MVQQGAKLELAMGAINNKLDQEVINIKSEIVQQSARFDRDITELKNMGTMINQMNGALHNMFGTMELRADRQDLKLENMMSLLLQHKNMTQGMVNNSE